MFPLSTLQVAQSELDLDTVRTILGEYKIHNADITLRYDATAEDLIDVVEGNRVYIPCIYLLNKIDQISIEVSNTKRSHCLCTFIVLNFICVLLTSGAFCQGVIYALEPLTEDHCDERPLLFNPLGPRPAAALSLRNPM